MKFCFWNICALRTLFLKKKLIDSCFTRTGGRVTFGKDVSSWDVGDGSCLSCTLSDYDWVRLRFDMI